MQRHALARPEQHDFANTLAVIVNNALRAATLAPTDEIALDIAGGALATIAQLARAEVRHD